MNLKQTTLNSLGYKNLITALDAVFPKKYSIIEQRQGEYDDFYLFISVLDTKIALTVGDTRAVGMMHQGAGGSVRISVEISSNIWFVLDSKGNKYDLLEDYVSSKEAQYLHREGSIGRDEQAIEKSLQILKKYLTHDSTYLQAKETIEKALQKVSQINQIVESEWKGQNFKDYLKVYEDLEESIISFNNLLEKGDTLLQEYEKESDLKNN